VIRTQIRLNKEEYEAAKAEAERLGIPLAELVAERTIDDVVYDKRDCK